MHGVAIKTILGHEGLRGLLVDMVVSVWETEEVPVNWESCLLKILAKPGDQSDAGNCRGVMLLEVMFSGT